MIAVVFEVFPKAEERDACLAMTADMRKLVDQINGFISVERFESLTTPGEAPFALTWDEAALAEWRQLSGHQAPFIFESPLTLPPPPQRHWQQRQPSGFSAPGSRF